MGKLINRIPGSRLLISSIPGSPLRTHVESLGKPRGVNIVLKALPGKLDIKRHSPSILYVTVVSDKQKCEELKSNTKCTRFVCFNQWHQFFTCCEELVPILHNVKFAKSEI